MNKNAKTSAYVGRAYAGLSLEQRRAARRKALIGAGLEIFGRTGFRGATVKSICRQAGLTERYFYESFVNNEDLFAAVYRACIECLETKLEQALAEADDPEQIVRVGLSTFFEYLQDPRVARVLLIEIFGISAEIDRTYRATTLYFAAMTEELIERIYDLDRLAADSDRRLLAMGLVGSTIHIAMYWTLDGYRDPLSSVVASSLELYRAIGRSLGHRT